MAARTLYFAELGPVWNDWIQVVNVGNAPTRVTCVGKNGEAQAIWSQERTVAPFAGWLPSVQDITVSASLTITADQPIVAERHMHKNTEVLDFPGASPESKTVGRRLFFPELVPGALDWFRILNVSEADAHVSITVRNSQGAVAQQRSRTIAPFRWWDIDEKQMGNVRGTVEVVSTQPVVAERHLHYQGGKVTVGQLGQVLDPD
jgi:hypothetical protein